MEQIVTHPLYIRCKKVIESCETDEQLRVAIKYCNLARTVTKHPHKLTTDCIDYFFDHQHYWDSLIYDANRMLWKSLVEEVKWNLTKCEESTMKH